MPLSDKISGAELEVMELIWQGGEGATSTEIRKALSDSRGWEKSTVLTLLRRLLDKGVIRAEKDGVTRYFPNITRDEFTAERTREMVTRLYGGSAKRLVAALCKDSELTEADLDELRAYLRRGD